jgi:hypothetical protein
MTTTTKYATRTAGASVVNFASGGFTGDNNTIQIQLGFVPRYFKLVNETDGIVWEKTLEMAAANATKHVATGPTFAVDTGSHVLFSGTTDGAGVGGVTLDTTAVPNNKVVAWVAFG